MDDDQATRRAWAVPPARGHFDGIDLSRLDPADADERGMLIRAEHPELAAAVEQGRAEIQVDGRTVNPSLHLSLHEAVASQLWEGVPPQVWHTAQRLTAEGFERHDVLHMLMFALSEQLSRAVQTHRPFDVDAYVAALDALPGSWQVPDDEPMQFSVDDEEDYADARDRLLEDFESWRSRQGLPDDGGADRWAAEQLLTFKWGYLDGHLTRWSAGELREILTELVPRKVALDDDEPPGVVAAARRFLRFLADIRLLDAGGDPLPDLERALDRAEPVFADRMRDPTRFGLAKNLMAQAAADGVDPADPQALQQWMEHFNALPAEERRRRLPLPGEQPSRPPVSLPDDDVLATQALATPALVQLRAFLDWLGDGRPLTQKGNLKLADGKALVDVLGTDDLPDEVIGERRFATRSAAELGGVDAVFRLALASRLARRQRGKLLPTRSGARRLAREPLTTWADVVAAMLELGAVSAGADWHGWWFEEFLEHGAQVLPSALYDAGVPVPAAVLSDSAMAMLSETYDLAGLDPVMAQHLPEAIASVVERVLDRLAWLGIVKRRDTAVEERWGRRRERAGTVELTPLGTWYVQRDRPTSPPTATVDLAAPPPVVVERLAGLLAGPGPAAAVAAVAAAEPSRQAEALAQLWTVDHPDTEAVLQALVSLPDAAAAKAARRALFKRRSARPRGPASLRR